MTTFQVTFSDHVVVSCDGFDILASGTFTIRRTIFFDQTGVPLRVRRHVMFTGTLTNSVTGTSVTDFPDPQNQTFDLTDGTTAEHGLVLRITVPSEGNVMVDAGAVILNPDGSVTLRGPHPWYTGEAAQILCAALQ